MFLFSLSIFGLLASAQSSERAIYPLENRQAPAVTPCSRLMDGSNRYAPSTVLACLQTIPFDPAVRDNIMGVTDVMYGQLDTMSANKGVDLQAEFKRINTTSYASDFDFQSDLSRTMASLNHAAYSWSSCYDTHFYPSHAIPLVALSPSGNSTDTNILIIRDVDKFIASAGLTRYYIDLKINLNNLAGAEVLGIDEKAPWVWIKENKLSTIGTWSDKQQRLNSVFSTYSAGGGIWSRLPGTFTYASMRDLKKDNITMVVKAAAGNETVVIPWRVFYSSPSGQSSWNYTSGEALQLIWPVPSSSSPLANLRSTPTGTTKTPSYLGGRDVMFFSLPNLTKAGVILIPSFGPYPSSQSCTDRFVFDLIYGLRNFTAAGIENVLVDTSNNRGGSALIAHVAQALLTGKPLTKEADLESVLRRSPLSEALLQRFQDPSLVNVSTIFNPAKHQKGDVPSAQDANYYSPGRDFVLNGTTIRTSNLLREKMERSTLIDTLLNLPNVIPFPPKHIVITGNRLCARECASFTSYLIDNTNGSALIQSAQPDRPIAYTASLGAEMYTSRWIYEEAAWIGFNNTTLLPRLNSAGSFGCAVRADIDPKSPDKLLSNRTYISASSFSLTQEMFTDQLVSWSYIASKAFPGSENTGGAANGAGKPGSAGWVSVEALGYAHIFTVLIVCSLCVTEL